MRSVSHPSATPSWYNPPVTRREPSDAEWELIEPFLPIGRYGPFRSACTKSSRAPSLGSALVANGAKSLRSSGPGRRSTATSPSGATSACSPGRWRGGRRDRAARPGRHVPDQPGLRGGPRTSRSGWDGGGTGGPGGAGRGRGAEEAEEGATKTGLIIPETVDSPICE